MCVCVLCICMYVDRVMEGDLMTWKTVLTGPAVEV